jgi:transcriptional regulator with PAS, ATPase and Fis domain
MTTDNSHELKRLAENQHTLLDAMPEMILLVNNGLSIEYMNPSAIGFFGDLCTKNKITQQENRGLCEQLIGLVENYLKTPGAINIAEGLIRGSNLEYSVAPFTGYKGDDLYWLILRDVTEHTKHKEELDQYNKSIESVLAYKVEELKESEQVRKQLSKQLSEVKQHLELRPAGGMIVGSSRAMTELHDMIFRIAKSDATILITGESGTGKELAANLICEASDRKDKPFLKINCNSINDQLLESDLFGYEKGAFTGAHAQRKGKFEVVDGGTLFLDEIGDISPQMQSSLLRVLQSGDVIRVGGNKPIKVDVRILAATNLDLATAVQQGTFRLDLYYRLNIINLSIPPLRERKEDLVELVTHFVKKYRKAFMKDVNYIPKPIINKLLIHDWPGNIRELENIIQRAVLMSKSNIITEQDIIFDTPLAPENEANVSSVVKRLNGTPLKNIVAEVEKEAITQKLKTSRGNVTQAAKELEVCKAALYEKMKRYDISAKKLR